MCALISLLRRHFEYFIRVQSRSFVYCSRLLVPHYPPVVCCSAEGGLLHAVAMQRHQHVVLWHFSTQTRGSLPACPNRKLASLFGSAAAGKTRNSTLLKTKFKQKKTWLGTSCYLLLLFCDNAVCKILTNTCIKQFLSYKSRAQTHIWHNGNDNILLWLYGTWP